MPKYFQSHGYWSARVSKIYHMGIPVDILEGTNGRDHEASWNERYNTPSMESMIPGKVVDGNDAAKAVWGVKTAEALSTIAPFRRLTRAAARRIRAR